MAEERPVGTSPRGGGHRAEWRRAAAIALVLAAALSALYWPVQDFEFISIDDNEFVYENPLVWGGLSAKAAARAFTTFHAAYWIPLTWISYMVDVEIFGMDAGGFHVTSAVLHGLNAILLFLLLWRMTGALWKSALAAAFFALHPLRVESVAWVTERKDVLSTFFFLLALLSYHRYAGNRRKGWYLLLLLSFLFGLMSKPMLITLPFLLLLCDHWPLGRAETSAPARGGGGHSLSWRDLILEKAPLFALSALFALLTLVSQKEALHPLGASPAVRLERSFTSFFIYLHRMIWPRGLTVEGVMAADGPRWGTLILAGTALALISAFALREGRRRPWVTVGWFWYVVALLPVSGIVQSGGQWLADRFTYLPQIGITIALVWGLGEWAGRWTGERLFFGAAMVLAALLGLLSSFQIRHWRSSRALFGHALAVSPENPLALIQFGDVLKGEGNLEEAAEHFKRAMAILPRDPLVRIQLGDTSRRAGRLEEAEIHFNEALRLDPRYPETRYHLAILLEGLERDEEALFHLREDIRLRPSDLRSRLLMVKILAGGGRLQEAEGRLAELDRLGGGRTGNLHRELGILFGRAGQSGKAVAHLSAALEENPDDAGAHFNLAVAYESSGRAAVALRHYREALRLNPGDLEARHNLERLILQGAE